MKKTPIGQLRMVGIVEGISYLILLGVAMPLKYLAGYPLPVRIVGLIHGVLFILFCMALLQAMLKRHWSAKRAGFIFAASFIPFGTFMIDKGLKKEDERADEAR